jgi:hypothetical protein
MNSIDEARRLRVLADDQKIPTGKGPALVVPAVSPNHVGILSPAAGGCPAGPPRGALPPLSPPHTPYIERLGDRLSPRATVLDSGYIRTEPPQFPMLDDYPPLPFAAAMQVLTGPGAPRKGVAVVAPAGNEESASPCWPAALPDVIGVACPLAAGDEEILPVDAWELLASGPTGVRVTSLADSFLTPFPGVTLLTSISDEP